MNAGRACNLLTGEEEIIVDGARLTICTIEKLNLQRRYPGGGRRRGATLVRPATGRRLDRDPGPALPRNPCVRRFERQPRDQLTRMILDCGDALGFHQYTRAVPLELVEQTVEPSGAEQGDALVAFFQKAGDRPVGDSGGAKRAGRRNLWRPAAGGARASIRGVFARGAPGAGRHRRDRHGRQPADPPHRLY